MRARDLLARLTVWRGRREPSLAQAENRIAADAASVPSTFPAEAYKLALDKLVEVAFEAGVRGEQARIATIVRLPSGERFPRLALSLALSGVVTSEQAVEAFAAAESDASARSQPTESPAAESEGRVLH